MNKNCRIKVKINSKKKLCNQIILYSHHIYSDTKYWLDNNWFGDYF